MYVPREIKTIFEKVETVYLLLALVGPRQAGKTTFLKEHLKTKKGAYLLFDDPDVRELFEENIKKFEKQYLEHVDVSVLDEIQYCKDAGRNLKYLAEKKRKLWLTSSSEVILGKNILSYLVGRVSILQLFPFSLEEFLASQGQKETSAIALKRFIWEHMTYGGYPKVVLTPDIELKQIILRDLHETMILKDIAQTFSIDNIQALQKTSKYLAQNTGNVFSYDTAGKVLQLSFPTIKKYLDAMEKSYLIVRIPPYFTNKNKEISKQPKIYFIDTGLRNALIKSFSLTPEGNVFENYVLSELLKAGFRPKYWRTKSKAEVDFIIEKDNKIIPIECKVSLHKIQIERSLHSFIEKYQTRDAFVVNYNGIKGKKKLGSCTVRITDVKGLIEQLK